MSDPNDQAETVTLLQSRIAELERDVETLNAVVVEQGNSLAATTKRLDALVQRFLVVEAQTEGQVPVDRPPHW